SSSRSASTTPGRRSRSSRRSGCCSWGPATTRSPSPRRPRAPAPPRTRSPPPGCATSASSGRASPTSTASSPPAPRCARRRPPPLKILPTDAQRRAAPQPLEALQVAIGSVAVSHAYRHYLASPDPAAPSDATYLYRTAARASASAAPAPKGGSDALTVVLLLI